MNARQRSIVSGLLIVVALCLAAVFANHEQSLAQIGGGAAAGQAQTGTPVSMDAERAQIWNSPNMLRARAWLQDYCRVSAKVTPEDAKKYMSELENMTPAQMKLWLLKFDQEEEAKQQQYAMWHQAHSQALSRAMAADRATQQSYAAIDREETEAAGEEQQQLNEQAAAEQNMEESKQLEGTGPYGPYGYPGYGGVHYHFHLYPY